MVNDQIVNNKWLRHVGYGFGDMSSSMFWKVFSYYLPFFYSNIFGLSLKDAGIILLVTRIWDAVSDPMMGIIADRTQTRWGKYRPYLLFVAPLFSIAGILLFTTPDWGYSAKLIWAYATYILMMTVYTGINVPYGAMLGVMTADSQEKTVYSSFRMFFAYGGSFLALFLWEPLCNTLGGYNSPQGWFWAMVVIAAACFVLFICCFLLTKEELKTVSTVSVGSDFKALLSNKPWWILIGAALCFNLFCTVRGATVAYYFADIIPAGAQLAIGRWSFLFYAGLFLAVGEVSNMNRCRTLRACRCAVRQENNVYYCQYRIVCTLGVVLLYSCFADRLLAHAPRSGAYLYAHGRDVASCMVDVRRCVRLCRAEIQNSFDGTDLLLVLHGAKVWRCDRRFGCPVAPCRLRIY